jgi:hypothetical protein
MKSILRLFLCGLMLAAFAEGSTLQAYGGASGKHCGHHHHHHHHHRR